MLFLFFFGLVLGQNCSSSLPGAPAFPTSTYGGPLDPPSTFVKNHWSQVVTLLRPTKSITTTQTNCPHNAVGLVNWQNSSIWPNKTVPGNGNDVTIPVNTSVLISSCSIPASYSFGIITIPVGSSLVFADAPIQFSASGFKVQGSLLIGSPTCRLRNKINITVTGARPSTLPAPSHIKGIYVTGRIDVHGVEYFPTWTRLAKTAFPGNKTIFIQDCPNWQPGQTVVITTTELKDARDFNRNEEAIIASVQKTNISATTCAVTFTTALLYKHYGGFEYQAEVALLSRNIIIQGDAQSEPKDKANATCTYGTSRSTFACDDKYLTGFGVHIQVASGASAGRFTGLQVYRGGQTNQMGRYPIHFHNIGNITTPDIFYATDCAVYHSFFRCFTIHGTSGTTLQTGVRLLRNVGYDVTGHCYFCSEDGIEENNTIAYNLGAHIHILGPYWQTSYGIANAPFSTQNANGAQSFGSQYTNWITSNPNLLLADDVAASVFYFTNSYNEIYGNAASGGWAGFAFPNLKTPVGFAYQQTWFVPKNRPLLKFKGNSAHSTGYWQSHASGVYLGGNLKIVSPPTMNSSGTMYTAGRDLPARDTCLVSTYGSSVNSGGCPASLQQWLRFEDTKVFLANVGLQSWGNREEIIRFEVHDVVLSTNVFGQVWIDQMLVNCRTKNVPTYLSGCNITGTNYWSCNSRDLDWWRNFGGFQFYDTGQSHLVTNSIFQNCQPTNNPSCVGNTCGMKIWTYLTHSDQFTPGLMQMTKNITYTNVNMSNLMAPSTTAATRVTVSGRAANWYDGDGTVIPGLFPGERTSIGSNWTGTWWKINSRCINTQQNWVCPMSVNDSLASVIIHWNSSDSSTIGTTTCSNGMRGSPAAYYPCPDGARVTHFGRVERDASYNIALMGRLTGPIIGRSGGWFVRFNGGTPARLNITDIQVQHDDVLHLAIPYPKGTLFKIWASAPTWCNPGKVPYQSWNAICYHDFRPVSTISALRAAWGDAYFYDSGKQLLHIRIVSMESFGSQFATNKTFNDTKVWIANSTKVNYFARGGLNLMTTGSSYWTINIVATNCVGTCANVTNATVPAALFPTYGFARDTTGSSESNLSVTIAAAAGAVGALLVVLLVILGLVHVKSRRRYVERF